MVWKMNKEMSRSTMSNKALVRVSDGWRVVDYYYGQAVWKLQAKSTMSTAASLFPQ
jgi:hypothetical protein